MQFRFGRYSARPRDRTHGSSSVTQRSSSKRLGETRCKCWAPGSERQFSRITRVQACRGKPRRRARKDGGFMNGYKEIRSMNLATLRVSH